MASTGSKWLMGCGIGCGVIVLLIIIVGTVGYFFIKDTVDTFKEAEASQDRVEELYGTVEDYCPEASGTFSADRIEAFLAVRDSMSPIIREWEEGLDDFSQDIEDVANKKNTFWKVLGLIGKGVGAIPEMVAFYTARNEALLHAEMGMGEYYYMYALIYYSWLGNSVADGPDFQLMGNNMGGRTYRYDRDDKTGKKEYEKDVREERRDRITRIVRNTIRPMMECQLEDLKDRGVHNSWRRALEAELDALEADSDRLPWQRGLPRVMDRSLRPFRERLEVSYSTLMNPLEIGPGEEW